MAWKTIWRHTYVLFKSQDSHAVCRAAELKSIIFSVFGVTQQFKSLLATFFLIRFRLYLVFFVFFSVRPSPCAIEPLYL